MSNFFEEALPVIAATAAAAVGVATGGTSAAITYAALAYSAGSEVSSGMAASDAAKAAAEAQEQSTKTQDLQQQYKIAKEQNQEAQIVHEQLAQNEMMAANRGVSAQSPSFNAIQVDTLRNAQVAMTQGTTASQISKFSASANLDSINREESAKQSEIFFGTMASLSRTVSTGAAYHMGTPSQARKAGVMAGSQSFNNAYG